MNKVDLHMHSAASHDGEFEPEEMVRMGKEAGLVAMSITDHNNINSVKRAKAAGAELGVEVLSGIEIDCAFEDVILHMLGYMFDEDDPVFEKLESEMVRREQAVGAERIARLREMGMPVTVEEVSAAAKKGLLNGPTIAHVLFAKPEARLHPLLKKYFTREGQARNPLSDFYWDFIAPGKPAYVPFEYFSLEDIVALIRGAGGVSVLAHPGAVIGHCTEKLEGIAAAGVRGVEVFCSYHSPEESAFYYRRTRELGLIPTLGSDFHGFVKPNIPMGACRYDGGDGLDLLEGLKAAAGQA